MAELKPLTQATQEVRDLFASTHWAKATMHKTAPDGSGSYNDRKHFHCLVGGIRHVLLGPAMVETLHEKKREDDDGEWDWLTDADVLYGNELPPYLLDAEQEKAYAALLREVVFAVREKQGRYSPEEGFTRAGDVRELALYDSSGLESILIDFNDNDYTTLDDVLRVLDRAREILAEAA